MGLIFSKHRHGNGLEHYASEDACIVLEIYPLETGQNPTTSIRIGFSVENLDLTIQNLEEVGGKMISAPRDSEWGRRAVMKDLDGHSVELITPRKANQ